MQLMLLDVESGSGNTWDLEVFVYWDINFYESLSAFLAAHGNGLGEKMKGSEIVMDSHFVCIST